MSGSALGWGRPRVHSHPVEGVPSEQAQAQPGSTPAEEDHRAITTAIRAGRVRGFSTTDEIRAALEAHDRQQTQDGSTG